MNDYQNLREDTSHGTFFLPCEYYYTTIQDPFFIMPMHWHEEMEITMIKKGISLYHIDLQPIRVCEGDIIVISPHMLHGMQPIEDFTMASDSFLFNLNMLGYNYPDDCANKYLHPLANQRWQFPLIIRSDNSSYAALAATFLRLKTCYQEKEPVFELELKSQLFHLLGLLFRCTPYRSKHETADTSDIMEKIKIVLLYIQEHYRQLVTVNELAKLCHFSSYHFMRFFKKHVDMTCIEYLNHYRLSMATQQLNDTDLPITSIALENGFNNISYFNRQFKNRFGMTPRVYRDLQKNE